MKLLTPKLDFVFKKLFATHPELLTGLLNAVLKLPRQRRITTVTVKNPQILATEVTGKQIVLDVLANAANGNQYHIEMQASKYSFYPKRLVYYLSKVYANQLVAGESYYRLRPVVSIHFIDYEQYPKRSAFHFCFECRERHYRKLCLTKDLSVHLIELPKFEKRLAQAQVTHDDLSEWLHFFNHAPAEEEKTMRTYYQNPLINQAFEVLEQLSADDATRQLAESREKALRDDASLQWELQEARQKVAKARQKVVKARQQGRQEGRQEGQQDLVKQLLASGRLTREELAQATGLSLAEVQELSK